MSAVFALILLFSYPKEAHRSFDPVAASPVVEKAGRVPDVLFSQPTGKGAKIVLSNKLRGGVFFYRPSAAKLSVDSGIVFPAQDGGFWERAVADTVKLSWYNISTQKKDNADIIKKGVQAAIDKKAKVVAFPAKGIYRIASGNYWSVPDNFNLDIDGAGSTIIVDGKAAGVAQETYVMAFKCTDINSINSAISIHKLNIRAPDITPKWTSKNYGDHRLVMAIETDGIYNVKISDCVLNDIYGYGIRLKNFVNANVNKVTENNVGGHFPVENGQDSFGDGIWVGQYDVQTVRSSRKKSYAKISNCVFKGYNTATNGNFASRCGITVEGFNSYSADIAVKVDVSSTTVAEYDRNLHVEGISAAVTYTNCTLRNFFGIGLVVKSPQTTITYNNTTASGLLKGNPQQEHYGLGGVMQFNSALQLYLNKSKFTFNGPASFRANVYLQDRSVLDFGNSDVFFDHADLHLKSGASIFNVPANVSRGFNMYGGTIDFTGGTITGAGGGNKGIFHGESIDAAVITGCKLTNSRLIFNGKCGYIEKN
jgi:hypothetical protein